MVRATAVEMVKLFGGAYPPGHSATTFGNYAATADTIIDTIALPTVLSTTDTNVVALANRIAVHLVHRSMWLNAGGVLSGAPEPPWLSSELIEQIARLSANANTGGWATLDLIEDD